MSPSAAMDVSPQATAEGFDEALVVMRSAWEATVEASSEREEQDRLALVIRSAASALQDATARSELPDRLRFVVRFDPLADRHAPVELDLVLDAPVLVIDLPDEA
ncbi:hypothetical protein [Segniliparus rugosus]|uniref:Uncharacterized protein n=1 Tax=Segniliparus rugosus (strain ATCC BAA-974 / DSM 45345 / CCUG 50838 / CIP 108380 / JCM 13579 / CDC 945) TaxID=679197 RepID=E5XKQ3_SEGRC|nr:hypothetical protein [Segniliparus rugosus]EFV15069.1 hypothetical protein HMPREF9336_00072 [Segniliparus rugosus ATCC BAA-974]